MSGAAVTGEGAGAAGWHADEAVAGLAVHHAGRADRLYREFHQRAIGGDSATERIRAALAEMPRAFSVRCARRTCYPKAG